MAKKKPEIRKHITEAKLALKTVMQENLTAIGTDYAKKVMNKLKSLPDSRRFDALGGLTPSGSLTYKQDLLSAMAIIASDALAQARKEIPSKKNIKLMEDEESLKLGEFEKLPPDLRARLERQAKSIIDKQTSDLVGAVNFQFQHSIDSTDSLDMIQADLFESIYEYADGAAVEAGSSTIAAQAVNESRNAFFFTDEVLDEIGGFIFTNGDPVTEICNELNGTVFAKDDPEADRFQPPLHFNCKSYIVPVLNEFLDEALKKAGQTDLKALSPSKKARDSIQFGEHFHDHD